MNEAQEEAFGVVVANMSCVCVFLCVFMCMRACLSCEEKSVSLSVRFFFASKKRQKIRTRSRSKHVYVVFISFLSFGERASAAPFPAFCVVVCI